MGRKKTQPQHMDAERRQQEDWNMLDGTSGPSSQQAGTVGNLLIMEDDDPALQREWEAAEKDRIHGKRGKAEAVDEEAQSTAGTSSQPSSVSAQCDVVNVMPDNVRQYFARMEIQLRFDKLENDFIKLPMYSAKHRREVLDDWHWVVGRFKAQLYDYGNLPLTSETLDYLSNFKQCWLYIMSESSHVLYFEAYDEEFIRERQDQLEKEGRNKKITRRVSFRQKQASEDHLAIFWDIELNLPDVRKFFEKLSRSGRKKFQLVYEEIGGNGKELQVTVYGRRDTLQKLEHPSQGFATREVNNFMLMAMRQFYDLGPICDRGVSSLHQDFQEFYEGVRAQRTSHIASTRIFMMDVQHPSLKPLLRPYQQDAVRWMLEQEQFGDSPEHSENEDDRKVEGDSQDDGKVEGDSQDDGKVEDDDLHPLYSEMTTRCGKTLYYNRQGGSLIMDKPKKVTCPPGGILADEMGLGKTVEVLCCILLHPRPAIPPPPRLPTLLETELQSEENSRDVSVLSASNSVSDLPSMGNDTTKSSQEENSWDVSVPSASSSVIDLPSMGNYVIKNSQGDQPTLKRVDSNNGSLSSVPSEAVSFVFTEDHSYQAQTQSAKEDHPEEDIRPPLTLTLKRLPDKITETLDPDSQPPAKKLLKSRKRKTRLSSRKRCRKGSMQPRPKKRKLPELVEDKGSAEVENAHKKPKGLQSGRFFIYVTDDEATKPTFFNNSIVKAHKQKFECVCGKGDDEMEFRNVTAPAKSKKHLVKCTECGISQHAECVNYDLEDPFRGPYKCPHCHYNGKQLPSGATLIISPYSIAHQWIEEIQKHLQEKKIQVFEYKGVRHHGYIQPQTLVNQDIVITTYETLRNDLNYVNVKPTNSDQGLVLRKHKKFMAHPTPLTTVEWWRICLDEAQMVESGTTKTAEMALRLSCVNRWCVTGTPLNQSIKDVYGLLAFIGYDPYCVEEWWTRCLYEPYLQGIKKPMFEALSKVMWRNSMKDVKAQLQLPDKSEVIKHLTFSPVEEVFYRRLYHQCSQEIFGSTLWASEEEKSTKLRKLDHHTVNKFLIPLRKLRQACCHPQAVSGSNLSLKNSLLTMEELLDNLIKKTTLECVESHRNMVASMNAQAGIFLIEDPPRVVEAVEMYRAVLRSVDEHEQQKELKTDALPQIHALHNLAQVLATKPPGVGHTTRDDQLTAQCEELKVQYLQRASNLTAACREQLAPLQSAVYDIMKQPGFELHWHGLVLGHAIQSGNEEFLVQRVKDVLADLDSTPGLSSIQFRDFKGLQYLIMKDLSEVHDCRQFVIDRMKKLGDRKSAVEAIQCCIRPALTSSVPLRTCSYCSVERDFLKWEQRLFSVVVSKRTQVGMVNDLYRGGSWQMSPLENILRFLQSYAKNRQLDGQILQNAAWGISLFELWKKEFKQLRALWALLKEEAGAMDELEMAVTRMRLALPGEEFEEQRDKNICDRVELPGLLRKFMSDQKIYANELKVRCGQLDYLQNLAKGNPGKFEDGINPEECPICRNVLGRNWSVLRCGHCCCISCIQAMIDRCPASRIHDTALRCMICREKTKTSEISYISTTRSSTDEAVKGSHSTKVGAIVKCVFDIQKEDSEAKVLVFATWVEVLKVIGKALDDNFIHYVQLFDHGHKYEKNITKFRTDKTVTVLLLPYSTGSKGLNLFEANHVVLVEPTYSPSEEAQAIGRVYRMGQTRPTKIYRFLVKSTIEERIYSLMESTLRPAADAIAANKDAITLGQLISLFEDCEKDPQDASDTDDETSQEDRNMGVSSGAGDSPADFAVPGPSHRPDVLASHHAGARGGVVVTGPSSSSGGVTGPSSSSGGVTGPSSSSGGVTGPSSSSGGVTGPSSSSGGVTGPNSSSGGVTGPNSSSGGVTGPSSLSAVVPPPHGEDVSSIAGPYHAAEGGSCDIAGSGQ